MKDASRVENKSCNSISEPIPILASNRKNRTRCGSRRQIDDRSCVSAHPSHPGVHSDPVRASGRTERPAGHRRSRGGHLLCGGCCTARAARRRSLIGRPARATFPPHLTEQLYSSLPAPPDGGDSINISHFPPDGTRSKSLAAKRARRSAK
ncbi:unnamed protein product [Nesidiocoris tenuis]|uniref:Uncharacterized protein n=1 Tax=Nesidiocoris tenuis TaxID=355587 RepID=A0A6H5H648_9HEMI|nr:unnamed protein product [Nesidiocoris tenuis]